MSETGVSALQEEGPQSFPMTRRDGAAGTLDLDVELGGPPMPANLPGWLIAATNADPALIASLADSPEAVNGVLNAALVQSQTAYDILVEQRGQGTLSQFNSALRWTTAYTDVTHSPDFRALLGRLEIPADIGPDDHQRVLDAIRDTFQALAQKVNDLERPPYGSQADLDFIKDKIARETQALIHSTGAVAYGETGTKRLGKVALTAATLTITAAPFAYAYYSNPTAWFYILGLSAAYLRTALLALGLMCAAGTTGRAIWQHVNERQLIWALPALFYSAQQYIITNANDNPEDEKAVAMGHTAKEIIEHKAFLTAVGAIEFALFVAANHPDKAAALFRKLRPKSQASRFAQGDTMAIAPDLETADDIRKYFKAGSNLIDIVNKVGDDWVSKGERLSDTQRQAMKAMRVDLAQLAGTLEAVVGGITTDADAVEDDQADGRNEQSLIRRMAQKPVDWGKAALSLPQIIRDMPPEEKKKLVVGTLLSIIGAILGAISSLAAIRVVALLTDYIPYYVATVLLLALLTTGPAYTASDVARTFGSYFGGTLIGLIPSIMNLISLFVTNEGFFDPVAHNSTLGLPANATFAPGHPSLELTEHPNIHGGDGWVNFGVITGVTMLAMLVVGGRLGDDISNGIIALLGTATSNDDDADSSRRDDDDAGDDDAPRDERDDGGEDAPREEERREDGGRRRSGEIGSTSGGQDGGSGAPETALAELRKLGASVSREDVNKITKATAAFSKAKDIALSLKPEELTFDPANPPADASEEQIQKAKIMAAKWEQDLEEALRAEASNKAGSSTQ